MAAHDSDIDLGGVRALVLGDEGVGADDVESGDTEELLGVVGPGLGRGGGREGRRVS